MLSYNVQIRTKLGSVRSKAIQAASEDQAISLAKQAFPLHDKVWIEGEAQEATDACQSDAAALDRISEMKRNAAIEKAKAKRSEGAIWFGVGLFLTLVTFIFVRNAFIIAFGPVIWGGFIYKSADRRIKSLTEEQAAGLPFIER